ncbi:MAG: hypothetical protein AAFV32_10015 [Myxococcota bacterium]
MRSLFAFLAFCAVACTSGTDRICGPGTEDNGEDCVPAIQCGRGAVLRGDECVVAEGALECGPFAQPIHRLKDVTPVVVRFVSGDRYRRGASITHPRLPSVHPADRDERMG